MSSDPRHWFLRYALLLTFLWWVLSEGVMIQLWFGVLVVIAATILTYLVTRKDLVTFQIKIPALIPFVPYFFYQSYKGGIDVAIAAFSPRRVLRPYYAHFPLSIERQHALARVVFASCMCLLPGTLSCRFDGDELLIHVLDEGMYKIDQMRHMEKLIANIFSLSH